jgi:hypothetical protein
VDKFWQVRPVDSDAGTCSTSRVILSKRLANHRADDVEGSGRLSTGSPRGGREFGDSIGRKIRPCPGPRNRDNRGPVGSGGDRFRQSKGWRSHGAQPTDCRCGSSFCGLGLSGATPMAQLYINAKLPMMATVQSMPRSISKGTLKKDQINLCKRWNYDNYTKSERRCR